MSSPRKSMSLFSRLSSKISLPMTGMVYNSSFSCLHAAQRRCYSSSSDLPPLQEIRMPSLSPTMIECTQKTRDFAALCKTGKNAKPCHLTFCYKCLLNKFFSIFYISVSKITRQ